MIQFRALGDVSLRKAGNGEMESVLSQQKGLALLTYLALARPRGFHRRSVLMALLWPEQDEQHARWSLNQALHQLRKALGQTAVLSRGTDEVGVNFEEVRVDALAFEEACERADPDGALEHYRGDLLQGFYVTGCDEFERWLSDERVRLRRMAVRISWSATDQLVASGELEKAVTMARRAIDLSDHDESGIRRLIELLDGAGDRAGALRAYEDYAARLREALDVEPAPETRELIAAVRSRQQAQAAPAPGSHRSLSRDAPTGPAEPALAGEGGTSSVSRGRHVRYLIAVAGVAAITMAVLAVLPVLMRDRAPVCTPPEASPGLSAPGVAVLPFTVSGSGWDELGEGMVDLVFANLDGLDGIRPIAPFTVLARWRERVPGTVQVDLATALQVAECSGAEYAIIGSVVVVGSTVRLSGSLYEIGRTEPIGQANETARPDSVVDAVDRLTIGLVRATGGVARGELARIDTREVTTDSPEALKAYLRAQALYRRADFEASAPEYERAIAVDSGFALAHLGLGWSLAWEPWTSTERARERPTHWQAALDHSLTERQALIARASLTYEGQRMSAGMVSELLDAVSRYPDDAQLSYLLGEHYLHVGTATGAFDDYTEKAEQAFEHAVALVPDFLPYSLHLMDLALIRGDGPGVEEIIARVSRIVPPDSRTARSYRALQRIFFLESPGTAPFKAALDTIEALEGLGLRELRRIYNSLLAQPDQWPATQVVIERLRKRLEPGWKDCGREQRSLTPGHLETFLAEALTPPAGDVCLYLAQMFGLPIPDGLADSVMTERLDSMVAHGAMFRTNLGVPLYFADHGRWSDHESVLGLWRASGAAALAADRLFESRWWEYFVTAAEGYGEWRRGFPERALVILESLPPEARVWPVIRWWLGSLYMDLDRPADAVRQFRTLQGAYPAPNWTLAYYRAGEAYEQLGEPEKAREQYAYFVHAWKDADPELQPWVERGRARLQALTASRE